MPNFFAASIAIGVQSPDVVLVLVAVDIVIVENALVVLWRNAQESVANIMVPGRRMINIESQASTQEEDVRCFVGMLIATA